MKNYNNKLANASFFAALCVVLIHVGVKSPEGSFSWWVYQLTSNGFCRWAVPFFFAASGYLLAAHIDEQGWWRTAVRKRIRTLLVPFVLWNVIYAIYGISLTITANVLANRPLTTNLLRGWDVLMYFGLHPVKGGLYCPLWFVETLFLFVLASPILVALIRRLGWIVPLALFGLCYAGLPSLPHNFNAGWMLYFAGGIAARLRPVAISKYLGGGVVFGMLWIYLHKRQMLLLGTTGHWDATPLPAVIILLVGIWALIPSAIRLPQFLAGVSFPIYVMHCIVSGLMSFVFPATSAFHQFVRWIACVGVCVILAHAMMRFVPTLSSVLFGARGKGGK